ncbi:hypothetical protein NDU88_005854 [Pleurodeles waltl]|uniref:Uncharacterized protein n=1 Tax=Pleurodeles waltl TaxID=8319 RepID=A0AAV7PGL6_PLEWA|nr:hypothetical protein NDU88_005854 [Pleurodeles waltl]
MRTQTISGSCCVKHQMPDVSVDVFYVCLRDLASTCTLLDKDDEIRPQFIQGLASSKLHERILQEPNIHMRDILTLGCSKELSKAWAAHMEQLPTAQVKSEPINAILADAAKTKAGIPRSKLRGKACRWCRGNLPHTGGCPAKGKTSSASSKLNHFSKVCHQSCSIGAQEGG